MPARVAFSVIAGPHSGADFTFDRYDTFLVGRSREAHLRLNRDPHFSRHHFRIEINPPDCLLVDLNSRSGTLVNGQRVEQAYLNDGDVISGGMTEIRVTLEGFDDDDSTVDLPAGARPTVETVTCSVPGKDSAPGKTGRPAAQWSCPGYDLREELGRGGMGVVFRALHVATGEECAVKMIVPTRTADEEAAKYFVREASLMSQLDHPRIVRFRDMGIDGGRFYLVMEFVNQESFDVIVRNRSTATRIRLACGVICQALEALEYAHRQSLVHRDVKPGNILCYRDGRRLRVKLADFGLAKNFTNAGFSGLSDDETARGTLAYMAPEQIANCRHAKPPCDIYAAGATLFRFLTGQLPFDFSTMRGGIAAIMNNTPRPLRDSLPEASTELERIVDRALAKNPDERFHSAEQMRRTLWPLTKRA